MYKKTKQNSTRSETASKSVLEKKYSQTVTSLFRSLPGPLVDFYVIY